MKREGNKKIRQKIDVSSTGKIIYISLFLLFLIYIMNTCGEEGIICFSIGGLIYLTLETCIFSGVSSTISQMIRYRIKREQYKSAKTVLRLGILISIFCGIILAILLFLLKDIVATHLVFDQRIIISFEILIPSICFLFPIGVLRGYFDGMGINMAGLHSMLLMRVILWGGGVIAVMCTCSYGKKVSNLLMNNNFIGVYGAAGASMAISIASAFGLLHLWVLYILLSRSINGKELTDRNRNTTKNSFIIRTIITSSITEALPGILFVGTQLIDFIIFFRLSVRQDSIEYKSIWANYFGVILPVSICLASFSMLIAGSNLKRIRILYEREEQRLLRDKLGDLFHRVFAWSVIIGILTAVLGDKLFNFISRKEMSYASGIAWQGVLIILLPIAYLLFYLLWSGINKTASTIIGILSIAVHIVLLLILNASINQGIDGIVLSNIGGILVLCIGGFLVLSKSIHYRPEWVRHIFITILCGAISGLIAMLLSKALINIFSDLIIIIICTIISLLVYIILLGVLHGFNEEELSNSKLGMILISFFRIVHIM